MSATDRVTPLVYKFSDHERVLEILSTRSESDITRFNEFLEHVENTLKFRLRYFYEGIPGNTRPGETMLRILDLADHLCPDSDGWKSNRFVISCLRIVTADSIDYFEKLEKNVQHQVWDGYYSTRNIPSTQKYADIAYLRLLHMTGMHSFPIVNTTEDINDYLEFARSLQVERATISNANEGNADTQALDFSTPTQQFLANLIYKLKNYYYDTKVGQDTVLTKWTAMKVLEPYNLQILLMLRALYGEERLLNLLDYFSESRQWLTANDMVNILEEWDELKEYPVKWIINIETLGIADA